MELQIKMPEPRPCIVRQEGRALLHGFFIHSWTHGASAMIGGFSAGQESVPMALVEFEDGRVDAVAVDAVRMLDSAQVFSEYCFDEVGE